MCGWESLLIGALGLGSSLLGPKPPAPPELPATDPGAARAAGATVRVGAGQDDQTTEDDPVQRAGAMPETRVFGKAIGGLGRSGLNI